MSTRRKTSRRGGLYIWRVRKPHAPIGLPIIGRHFGYGGMTNSHERRANEHLLGSRYVRPDGTVQVKPPASWSDLDPKRYTIGLPAWTFATPWRRKWSVESLETLLLAVTIPVYNERQQAPWNLRKISRKKAARMRIERESVGAKYSAGARLVLRWLVIGLAVSLLILVWGWLK
jgi:hypothetical protein